jgi:hypothetical protein
MRIALILLLVLVSPTFSLADQSQDQAYNEATKELLKKNAENYERLTGAKRGFSFHYVAGLNLSDYDKEKDSRYSLDDVTKFYFDIFDKVDTNSDKKINATEFDQALDVYRNNPSLSERDTEIIFKQATYKFNKLDENADKTISMEEFMMTEVPNFMTTVFDNHKTIEAHMKNNKEEKTK